MNLQSPHTLVCQSHLRVGTGGRAGCPGRIVRSGWRNALICWSKCMLRCTHAGAAGRHGGPSLPPRRGIDDDPLSDRWPRSSAGVAGSIHNPLHLMPFSAWLAGTALPLPGTALLSILPPPRGGLEGFGDQMPGMGGPAYLVGLSAGTCVALALIRPMNHLRAIALPGAASVGSHSALAPSGAPSGCPLTTCCRHIASCRQLIHPTGVSPCC